MAVTEERARISIEVVDKGLKTAVNKINQSFVLMRKNVSDFNNVLTSNFSVFKGMTDETTTFASTGGKMAQRLRELTHGARGFRMELLGVMFFGMAVQRLFMSMLKPAMELFGMFELWNELLSIFFLPIMETLMPYFLDLFNWFINLPDPLKELIGWVVIGGLAFGILLGTLGQLGLGIGSLILAFPGLITLFKSFVGLLGPGLSFALVFMGIQDLSEGKILGGIGTILSGVGWFIKGPLGIAAFGIGIALQLAQILKDGGEITTDKLIQLLISAGLLGAKVGGPYGVVIAIGLTFAFVFREQIMAAIEDFLETVRRAVVKTFPFMETVFGQAGTIPSDVSRGGASFRKSYQQYKAGNRVDIPDLGYTSAFGDYGGSPIRNTEVKVEVNQTNDYNITNMEEVRKMIEDSNRTLKIEMNEELKKLIA